MAFSTAKLSELPLYSSVQLRSHSSLKLLFSSPKPSFFVLRTFSSSASSSLRTAERRGYSDDGRNPKNRRYPWDDETHRRNTTISRKPRVPSSPWLKKWPPATSPAKADTKTDGERRIANSERRPQEGGDGAESQYFDGDRGRNAIARIVHRLRNLGLGSDDDYEEDFVEGDDAVPLTGEEKLGDLLKRTWSRPDSVVSDDMKNGGMVLPWERDDEESGDEEGMELKKKRKVKAPTLAELTIEDAELRRLRTIGMTLRDRINIPKAGVTQVILEKIHEQWRKSELVRLKFHETLAHDMKTAHEIVEHRTGGLVIWRSGSVMVVHRGSNYEGPASRLKSTDKEGDALFVPDVLPNNNSILKNEDNAASTAEVSSLAVMSPGHNESMTEEETEYNRLLDGLGPRFVDWWSTGVLPVDADLLPQSIPGYRTPFRLLPTGMRSRLTNAEMTNLRKLAKSLPCHFAMGRNRNHQGLAAAIVKLWEKSLIVKIAVKRGIQNTNNKLMAEELKILTGGILLLRNKYYIVIYRGKDFLPTSVAAALAERQELAKEVQDVEEKSRSGSVGEVPMGEIEGPPLAGTLAEYHEAQARWGREISAEERARMREEASKVKTVRIVKKIEHKHAVAQAKILRAERLLAKIEASMVPVGPDDDKETITDEERFMFRRVGLRMKSYLPLGIRGVFDGVIENMHLHWKHRELVKLISKQKNLSFVEDTAKLLEYESGGILVAIERVPKGHALIYYRGKNYKRPISLRPRNLLTKAKALKRSVAMQRHEALSQHISELERTIEQMKSEIGDSTNAEDGNSWSLEDQNRFDDVSEFANSEEEGSYEDSGGDEDEENLEEDTGAESDFLVNHDMASKNS
ncbi:CRM-domain containing factor CFM3, chloroplastic/mitochondrial [Telopea speciosissima]|uniref:CRM-domain containing factor CFM3, chloroplastic/mitochondrial n=1 Tax=Telopea speciosissima TaxID=54955 RepID=UPI001CC81DF4|nr:CRM-domain containing factor CFM3, chloroplastic/mitochondrial [Telopea speciosissima]